MPGGSAGIFLFNDPMAGYSGTPLAKKLGIKAGARVFVANGPPNYRQLLEPLPDEMSILSALRGKVDLIHVFVHHHAGG